MVIGVMVFFWILIVLGAIEEEVGNARSDAEDRGEEFDEQEYRDGL